MINFDEAEVVDWFVMMSEMGFFVPSGQSYQMGIPVDLSLAKVKAAAQSWSGLSEQTLRVDKWSLCRD